MVVHIRVSEVDRKPVLALTLEGHMIAWEVVHIVWMEDHTTVLADHMIAWVDHMTALAVDHAVVLKALVDLGEAVALDGCVY